MRIYTDDREGMVSAVMRKDEPDGALNLIRDGAELREQGKHQQEGIRHQQQAAAEAQRAEEAAARDREQSRRRAL